MMLMQHSVWRGTSVPIILMFARSTSADESEFANCWITSIFAPALLVDRIVNTLKPSISNKAYMCLLIS